MAIGRRARNAAAVSGLFILAIGAWPQNASAISEAEGRRRVVPYIRAFTECLADHIRVNEGSLRQARVGNWKGAISLVFDECDTKGMEMILAHDQIYGQGTGLAFLKGAYLSDLPRALQGRLQSDLDRSATAEQAERDRVIEKERQVEATLDAKKKLVAEAVAQHEDCLVSALYELAPYSSESAPTIVDVALDRCGKFAERRIAIGVGAYDMTREEAKAIVDRKVAEMRTKMITAVVTARAEAVKRSTGSEQQSPKSEAPTTSEGLPKAQPL